MNQDLLAELSKLSEEERQLLNGASLVLDTICTNSKELTMDAGKLLARNQLMAVRTHTRFVHYPKHRHNYVEIVYMCSGKTVHIVNDKRKITLRKGEILFLNQNDTHEIQKANEQDVAVNFIVTPEFLDIAVGMVNGSNQLSDFFLSCLRSSRSAQNYLYFQVSEILSVQNLLENMIWSTVCRQQNLYRINQTTMGLLFLELLAHKDMLTEGEDSDYDSKLLAVILEEIEKNYKTISLSEIARRYNQPLPRLSRIVSTKTGTPFKDLLRHKRFGKAVQLLCTSTLPVRDIIAAVGYENSSYFYHTFQEKYGVKPSEYRQRHF